MTQGKNKPIPANDPTGLDADYQRDWPRYFDAVTGKPPRETAILALKRFSAEGHRVRRAIDIACGEGRDTRAILSSGPWHVTAVDGHDEAIKRTLSQLHESDRVRCEVVQARMEEIAGLPSLQRAVDFVNASFALPFCQPAAFPVFWKWVRRALNSGGRFAGQFFGERDDWYSVRPASHVSRQKIEELFDGFDVEHLEEVEKDGDDAMGGMKHHHVFHVVARKR